jgi:hypothetical protein
VTASLPRDIGLTSARALSSPNAGQGLLDMAAYDDYLQGRLDLG